MYETFNYIDRILKFFQYVIMRIWFFVLGLEFLIEIDEKFGIFTLILCFSLKSVRDLIKIVENLFSFYQVCRERNYIFEHSCSIIGTKLF